MAVVGSTARPKAVRSPYQFVVMHRAVSFVALLLLVVMSVGGTSYAAQGSLPGDFLYPVKISVNEQVQAALAVSPVAKAQVHASLAERRLEEAQQLAVRGTLDATTTMEIQQNLTSHMDIAQTIARNIATTNPAASTQIATQLSSSLAADDAVLASIADRSSKKGIRRDSFALSQAVQSDFAHGAFVARHVSSSTNGFMFADSRSRLKHSDMRGVETTATTTPSVPAVVTDTASTTATPPVSSSAVGQLARQAKRSLSDVQGQYAALGGSLDTTTAAAIQTRLAGIQSQLDQGDAALTSGDTTDAYADYTNAIGAATRLQTLLKASKRFRPAILKQLFDTTDMNGDVLGTSTVSTTANDASSVDVPSGAPVLPGGAGLSHRNKKHQD